MTESRVRRQEGRIALVTGASKGIGRATAVRLAEEGAAVIVNYNSDSAGALETVRQITAIAQAAIPVQADVSDQADVERMVEMGVDRFGKIDILINNAAVFPWQPWTEIAPEQWDRVLAVNLKGCFLMARAVYPGMKEQGWGRIISMSSATYLTGSSHLAHYAASKAGIVGLTRSLARALADDGITVNAVTTGRTLTEGFQRWFEDGTLDYEEALQSRQSQPIKRIAVPADIVGTVAFLASDDAAYMTGQLLNVDGGRNMY